MLTSARLSSGRTRSCFSLLRSQRSTLPQSRSSPSLSLSIFDIEVELILFAADDGGVGCGGVAACAPASSLSSSNLFWPQRSPFVRSRARSSSWKLSPARLIELRFVPSFLPSFLLQSLILFRPAIAMPGGAALAASCIEDGVAAAADAQGATASDTAALTAPPPLPPPTQRGGGGEVISLARTTTSSSFAAARSLARSLAQHAPPLLSFALLFPRRIRPTREARRGREAGNTHCTMCSWAARRQRKRRGVTPSFVASCPSWADALTLARSPPRPYHVNIRPRAGPRLSLRATPPPRCRPDEYRSERDERHGGLGHSGENEFTARTATDGRTRPDDGL